MHMCECVYQAKILGKEFSQKEKRKEKEEGQVFQDQKFSRTLEKK